MLYVDLAVVLGGDIHVLVVGVVGLGREDQVAVDDGHAAHDGVRPVDGRHHDVPAARGDARTAPYRGRLADRGDGSYAVEMYTLD